MATNKRELRLMINDILRDCIAQDVIDAKMLDGKLADAVTRFYEKTGRGVNPTKARGDIVDGMLAYQTQQRNYDQMTERIEKALHLRPDGGDKWNEIIKFLMAENENGRTIEKYAEWCAAHPFDSPKSHQIAMNPGLIKTTWPGAFVMTAKEIKQSFDPYASLLQYKTGD